MTEEELREAAQKTTETIVPTEQAIARVNNAELKSAHNLLDSYGIDLKDRNGHPKALTARLEDFLLRTQPFIEAPENSLKCTVKYSANNRSKPSLLLLLYPGTESERSMLEHLIHTASTYSVPTQLQGLMTFDSLGICLAENFPKIEAIRKAEADED